MNHHLSYQRANLLETLCMYSWINFLQFSGMSVAQTATLESYFDIQMIDFKYFFFFLKYSWII